MCFTCLGAELAKEIGISAEALQVSEKEEDVGKTTGSECTKSRIKKKDNNREKNM